MNTIKKSSFPLKSPDLINNSRKHIIFDLTYFLLNPVIEAKGRRINLSIEPILKIELRKRREDLVIKFLRLIKSLKKQKALNSIPNNAICITVKLLNGTDIVHDVYLGKIS